MRKSFGKALAVLIVIALVTAVTLYYSLGRKSVEKPAPTLTTTTITTTLTTTSTATETITKTITTTILTRTTLITTTVFVIERYTETMIKTVTVTVAPLDSDGDSIPDEKELEYGTDPYKPNYLFAYALKKLPEEEALKFRNVENFNASSISLVDLYTSLPQDKRNSKEVNELLKQILLDNTINELEKNLFDDKFVHPTQPTVINLSWVPTRTNLDKIYDIKVTFVARDDKTPIAYAELHFKPVEYQYMIDKYGMRPEDYSKVFPPDSERVFVLTPVDGRFDNLEKNFTVSIKDIVGGREYKIVALVRDLAGNEKTVEVKTPYIRQFENIAKTDDIIVVAPYYLWYRRDLSNWRDGHKYTPLLGEYRSDDPIVMSKHIDWATGHGVDVFAVSWTGYEYGDLKYFDDNLKLLFNNPLSKDIKIMILYESPGRLKTTGNPSTPWEKNLSDEENIKTLISDFIYFSREYFNRENYFKLDGRPVVYIYDSSAFMGNVSGTIQKLREAIRREGYEVFLISDHVHPYVLPGSNPDWEERARQFDGITSWLGGYSGEGIYLGGSYEAQLGILYSQWGGWVRLNNKKLVPFITPEFDNRQVSWGNPNSIPIERSPQLFIQRLIIALNYTEGAGIVMIGTWNDFFESTTLEPTATYGFTYLALLKEVLAGYGLVGH